MGLMKTNKDYIYKNLPNFFQKRPKTQKSAHTGKRAEVKGNPCDPKQRVCTRNNQLEAAQLSPVNRT